MGILSKIYNRPFTLIRKSTIRPVATQQLYSWDIAVMTGVGRKSHTIQQTAILLPSLPFARHSYPCIAILRSPRQYADRYHDFANTFIVHRYKLNGFSQIPGFRSRDLCAAAAVAKQKCFPSTIAENVVHNSEHAYVNRDMIRNGEKNEGNEWG